MTLSSTTTGGLYIKVRVLFTLERYTELIRRFIYGLPWFLALRILHLKNKVHNQVYSLWNKYTRLVRWGVSTQDSSDQDLLSFILSSWFFYPFFVTQDILRSVRTYNSMKHDPMEGLRYLEKGMNAQVGTDYLGAWERFPMDIHCLN